MRRRGNPSEGIPFPLPNQPACAFRRTGLPFHHRFGMSRREYAFPGASGRGGPLGSGERERSGGAGSGPRGGRLYLSRFRKMVLVSVYWSWDSRPLSLPPNPESL